MSLVAHRINVRSMDTGIYILSINLVFFMQGNDYDGSIITKVRSFHAVVVLVLIFFSFIQIDSGHAVNLLSILFVTSNHQTTNLVFPNFLP